eukprot:358296-Chlamydomonas_euryale.AAC.2
MARPGPSAPHPRPGACGCACFAGRQRWAWLAGPAARGAFVGVQLMGTAATAAFFRNLGLPATRTPHNVRAHHKPCTHAKEQQTGVKTVSMRCQRSSWLKLGLRTRLTSAN